MVRQENLSANPPEQALSPIEIDQQAFELIREFKASFELRKPKDSTRRPDRHTYGVEPGMNDLSIGKIRYRGFYNPLGGLVFFGTRWVDYQSLLVEKDVRGKSSHDVVTDRLHLLSRRPQDQQFSPLADIAFNGNIRKHPDNVLLRFNDLHRPVPPQLQENEYINTPTALQKAREMLAGLTPQK